MLRTLLLLVVVGSLMGCAGGSKAKVLSSRVGDRLKTETHRFVVLPSRCTSAVVNKLSGSTFCDDHPAAGFDGDLQRILERQGHVATLGRDVVASLVKRDNVDASFLAYATGLGLAGGRAGVSRAQGSGIMDAPPALREQLVKDVGADGVAELSIDFGYDRVMGNVTVLAVARLGLGAFREEPLGYVECQAEGWGGSGVGDIVGEVMNCVQSELHGGR